MSLTPRTCRSKKSLFLRLLSYDAKLGAKFRTGLDMLLTSFGGWGLMALLCSGSSISQIDYRMLPDHAWSHTDQVRTPGQHPEQLKRCLHGAGRDLPAVAHDPSLKLVPAWNKLRTKIGELLLKEEPRTLTTSLSSVLTTFSRIMTVGLRNLKDSWFYLIKSAFYSVRLGATTHLGN